MASASLVKGHNLSAGISTGEPSGKNSRSIPSGRSTSRVPADLVHHTWADRPMVVTLAAVIGLVLFTIGAMEHPFSGGARIGTREGLRISDDEVTDLVDEWLQYYCVSGYRRMSPKA